MQTRDQGFSFTWHTTVASSSSQKLSHTVPHTPPCRTWWVMGLQGVGYGVWGWGMGVQGAGCGVWVWGVGVQSVWVWDMGVGGGAAPRRARTRPHPRRKAAASRRRPPRSTPTHPRRARSWSRPPLRASSPRATSPLRTRGCRATRGLPPSPGTPRRARCRRRPSRAVGPKPFKNRKKAI